MNEVPLNYREITDKSVYDIGIATQKIIPIIEELGDSLEIQVEDYIVLIKRKNEIAKTGL
jgi:hypothetical protein